jgi:hypothetical protein
VRAHGRDASAGEGPPRREIRAPEKDAAGNHGCARWIAWTERGIEGESGGAGKFRSTPVGQKHESMRSDSRAEQLETAAFDSAPPDSCVAASAGRPRLSEADSTQAKVVDRPAVVGDGRSVVCAIIHHSWKLEGILSGMGNFSDH